MREIHQLRDVKSWEESGIKLSTASDEAAKLFDAAISQFVGWYDEKQLDGLESTLTKMIKADPEFISGRTLVYSLQAVGFNDFNNSVLKNKIEKLALDVENNSNSTRWEKRQLSALQNLSRGNIDGAIRQWEDILVEFPSDILSVHMTGLTCLKNGCLEQMRDISGRILPSFRDEYSVSTLHGWYSIGLGESNLYKEAEQHARIGVSLDPRNGWTTHSLAHVFEMSSRYDDGINYMGQCESMWSFSNHLAGHNYWHWSLYYLTKGDFESAIDILEKNIINGTTLGSLSLSYLLSMEDFSPDELLNKYCDRIGEIVQPYMNTHNRSFVDVHIMMGLCVSKKYDEAEQFMSESIATAHLHGRIVNENLLRAILAYSREKYATCCELIWPIRYKIKQIGGSEAQRDIFHLMLINACLRSNKLEHRLLAGQLIEEREMYRSKSPLIDRLRNILAV